MEPLHEYIFSILRRIKEDATFDQEKGIENVRHALDLKTDKAVYSFDLSAATDRLPLELQKLLLDYIREGLGRAWSIILVGREYHLPKFSG